VLVGIRDGAVGVDSHPRVRTCSGAWGASGGVPPQPQPRGESPAPSSAEAEAAEAEAAEAEAAEAEAAVAAVRSLCRASLSSSWCRARPAPAERGVWGLDGGGSE
jgi:hypothetical protein